jgi:2-(1,2-epoxy-1,2-dihydrophenyl)acetyl-CoA isomerase
VLRIVLNRPEAANALDRNAALDLLCALHAARYDDTVRAIVLTGAGNAFCAGDDLEAAKAFLDGRLDDPRVASDPYDATALYIRIGLLIAACEKPVIAAINGPAIGAGLELACAADVRIMKRSARLGAGVLRIGHAGVFAFLSRIVGASRAMDLYLAGRLIGADEAYANGIVSDVFDDAAFDAGAREVAERFAAMPTRTIGIQKQMRNSAQGRSLLDVAMLQDAAHRHCMTSVADAREGVSAFIEKRLASFSGT